MESSRLKRFLEEGKKKADHRKVSNPRLRSFLSGEKKDKKDPKRKIQKLPPLDFIEGESREKYLDRLYDLAGFVSVRLISTNVVTKNTLKINARMNAPKNSVGHDLGFSN